MAYLPEGYRISKDRIPEPGKNITEAIGLEDLVKFQEEKVALTDGTAANAFARTIGLLSEIDSEDVKDD